MPLFWHIYVKNRFSHDAAKMCLFSAMFDMSRETDVSLQLYSRKVMIMSKANNILPKWMRFVKGKFSFFHFC